MSAILFQVNGCLSLENRERVISNRSGIVGGRSMQLIQAKPSEGVFTGAAQSQAVSSKVKNIAQPARIKYLRIVLQLVGVTFIFGIYTLTLVWPSGWSWHTGHIPHYLQMILGVYA